MLGWCRDEQKKARPFKEFDFAKAEEEKEAKIAERLATPGLGEVPWCRDGDDAFRKDAKDREQDTGGLPYCAFLVLN